MKADDLSTITPSLGYKRRYISSKEDGRLSQRDSSRLLAALKSANKDKELYTEKARKAQNEIGTKDKHMADLMREWEKRERRYKRKIVVLTIDLKKN